MHTLVTHDAHRADAFADAAAMSRMLGWTLVALLTNDDAEDPVTGAARPPHALATVAPRDPGRCDPATLLWMLRVELGSTLELTVEDALGDTPAPSHPVRVRARR